MRNIEVTIRSTFPLYFLLLDFLKSVKLEPIVTVINIIGPIAPMQISGSRNENSITFIFDNFSYNHINAKRKKNKQKANKK